MSSRWTTWLFPFLWFALSVAGDNSTVDGYNDDPILRYRPNFARSLPVQILLTGVVLTLVAVLFIHLLFTVQYHWPLAQVNYILQMSGVTTLLISLIATLHVVLAASIRESRTWPYMLSYLAVDTPPLVGDVALESGWTVVEQATWLVMNATTSVLIQITHIHFLTLLYPSRLEARLIYFLLGPLAILAAIMQLLPIQGNPQVVNYSDAIRNICNATLSLLFTASLFIWGFLVNRKQAWRTDGGTAVFGAGALFLALLSTALNFLYIPSQDQYVWLPGLMWAVVLWQSFLGWWWWVGAGMGVGEVEELLRREEKRERKRKLKKEKRREQREKAKMVWKGMTGAFSQRGKQGEKCETDDDDETIIVDDDSEREQPAESGPTVADSRAARIALGVSAIDQTTSASSTTSGTTSGRVMNTRAGRCLHKWWGIVRLEHLTAARNQAVERVERIHQVYGREEGSNRNSQSRTGWGLGSFSAREAERETRREQTMSSDEEEADRGSETLRTTRARKDRNGQGHMRYRDRPVDDDTTPDRARIEAAIQEENRHTSSMWWWGPLRRWRLQDATVYSS